MFLYLWFKEDWGKKGLSQRTDTGRMWIIHNYNASNYPSLASRPFLNRTKGSTLQYLTIEPLIGTVRNLLFRKNQNSQGRTRSPHQWKRTISRDKGTEQPLAGKLPPLLRNTVGWLESFFSVKGGVFRRRSSLITFCRINAFCTHCSLYFLGHLPHWFSKL